MSPNVQLTRMHPMPAGGVAVEIAVAGKRLEGYLKHVGSHNLSEVLAQLSDVYEKTNNLGAVAAELQQLATWQPAAGHGNVISFRGATIIDDTATTAIDRIRAGLYTLAQHPGRHIVVLSGSWDEAITEDISDAAHVFVAVGEEASSLREILLKKGEVDTHHFTDSEDATRWLRRFIRSGDTVYITGQLQSCVDLLK